ncbi:hypothetical protein D1007_06854 [Hordeum vulgare]|nr:hypothetical protein D1007_06854 [Hordeum vulgare]
MERARLAAGWCQLEASAKEVRGEDETAHAEGQHEAAETKAACSRALAEKEALAKCYEEAKPGFKALQEATKAHEAKLADCDTELVKVAAQQVKERGRVEALQREVAEARGAHAKQVSEANTNMIAREEEVRAAADVKEAAEHVVLSSLEVRARQALSSIYRLGLESPFIPQDTGYTKFSSELVKELEGVAKKVDNILEEECRNLFSMVGTHVFSYLFFRDPHFEFEEVMCPVHEEFRGDLVTAVEGHVCTLLEKFSYDDEEEPARIPLPCPQINYPCLGEVSDNIFII